MSNTAARLLLAGLLLLGPAAARGNTTVSVSFFHQELAPYGSWVNVAPYGVCWHPARVAVGWQPYTVGHWVYTDYGWTWISEDPWGEYPYHYGSWTFAGSEGWVWVPGVVWSPAWVTWSYSDEFVGWAPVPPDFALTASGYVGPPIVVSQTRYVFVPVNRFVGVNVARVRVPVAQNQVILARSQRVTGFSVSGQVVHNTALPLDRVERASGGRIERVSIEKTSVRPAAVNASASHGTKVAIVAPARTREEALVRVASKETKESAKQTQKKKPATEEARPEPQAVRPAGKVDHASPAAAKPSREREREQQAPPAKSAKANGNAHAAPAADRPPPSQVASHKVPPEGAASQNHHERTSPPAEHKPPQPKKDQRPKPPPEKPEKPDKDDR